MSEQLVLDLPHRPALEADDFLVSGCNAAAVRLIDAWPDWPGGVQVICGPAGSGKSHLANVWCLKSGATRLAPESLARRSPGVLPAVEAFVIEDLDRVAIDEHAMFHLLNSLREEGVSALLTARTPPASWQVHLPDLESRLRSIPVVTIGAPDDDLLQAVLLKQFTDRQLNPEPHVIAFLVTRMERSMEAVRHLVAALDRAALAAGRKITRPMAAEVLEELAAASGSDAV